MNNVKRSLIKYSGTQKPFFSHFHHKRSPKWKSLLSIGKISFPDRRTDGRTDEYVRINRHFSKQQDIIELTFVETDSVLIVANCYKWGKNKSCVLYTISKHRQDYWRKWERTQHQRKKGHRSISATALPIMDRRMDGRTRSLFSFVSWWTAGVMHVWIEL